MDDAHRDEGALSRIPVWDGDPTRWEVFRKDVEWWLAGEDLNRTMSYNLAARFVQRQKGTARSRAREFTPVQLQAAQEVKDADGNVTTPANPRAGIDLLMAAFAEMIGKTTQARKLELRDQFHKKLYRLDGERIIDFASRYRTLVAQMRAEGIALDDDELSYQFREKLNLSAERLELLETAVGDAPTYQRVETEAVRLFGRVHLTRTRQHPAVGNPDRNRLHSRWGKSSAASSSTLPSSASQFRRNFRVNEAQAETSPQEDESSLPALAEDGGSEYSDGGFLALEAALQHELEDLAGQLDEAEQESCDPELLQELENSAETLTEAFITMKEAKSKLSMVRKDRGYKGPGRTGGKGGGKGLSAADKKSSGKYPCFDCGSTAHWAGDASCPKPGAGLFKRGKGGAGGKPTSSTSTTSTSAHRPHPPRQVRVAEFEQQADVSEHFVEVAVAGSETLVADQAPDALADRFGFTQQNVAAMAKPWPSDESITHVISLSNALGSADVSATNNQDQQSTPAYTDVLALAVDDWVKARFHSQQHDNTNKLMQALTDKIRCGAVDSACNRTCTGRLWIDDYRKMLIGTPVEHLISVQTENEAFRFGNGGKLISICRARIPVCINGHIILLWVSVIPCESLGLLLGKDFCEAIGGVIDFTHKQMKFSVLSDKWYNTQELRKQHMACRHSNKMA